MGDKYAVGSCISRFAESGRRQFFLGYQEV